MKLTHKEREALKNSDFGLPKVRKYPLHDEEHVKLAIKFFKYATEDEREELAKNINRRAKDYNMTINISDKNAFYKYADKDIINEDTIFDLKVIREVLTEKAYYDSDDEEEVLLSEINWSRSKNDDDKYSIFAKRDIFNGNIIGNGRIDHKPTELGLYLRYMSGLANCIFVGDMIVATRDIKQGEELYLPSVEVICGEVVELSDLLDGYDEFIAIHGTKNNGKGRNLALVNENLMIAKVDNTKTIYHGSYTQGLKEIKPSKSYSYSELPPIVFGSTRELFASAFCLQWRDENLKLSTEGGFHEDDLNNIELWMRGNMDFSKPCSIYEIENNDFYYLRRDKDLEVVSTKPCKVIKEHKFKSFNDVVRKYNINIITDWYDKPYDKEEIKKKYGLAIYNKLMKDDAHKFRAETGIELIHREPTIEELDRIWKNWNLMNHTQKEKSDKKSIELFGVDNETNYNNLRKSYKPLKENLSYLYESLDIINEKVKPTKLIEKDNKIPVYILLTTSESLTSKTIRKVTNTPYSHVSLSFDHELHNMYSFATKTGVKTGMEALLGGFKNEDITKFKDGYRYSLYVTFVDEITYENMKNKINEFIENVEKYTYNQLGLLAYLFKLNIDVDNSRFCSEFVAEIMNSSGKTFINKHKSQVIPYDFSKLKNSYFISRGLLKNYNADKVMSKVKVIKDSLNDVINESFNDIDTVSFINELLS